MSDIEPVRHEPKKLAGRQQRHVEVELAGFERGIRAAVTADGRWRVTLTAPQAGETAVLQTPDGTLVLSNWTFEVAAQ